MTMKVSVFKPLLSPAMLAKMKVIGHSLHAIGKGLLLINVEELPTQYGGTMKDAW